LWVSDCEGVLGVGGKGGEWGGGKGAGGEGDRGENKEGEGEGRKEKGERGTYRVVDDILTAGIVIYVYGDAAEGGDFGGELGEAVVVLGFAFVGV